MPWRISVEGAGSHEHIRSLYLARIAQLLDAMRGEDVEK